LPLRLCFSFKMDDGHWSTALALALAVVFAVTGAASGAFECLEGDLTVPAHLEFATGGAFEHSFDEATGVLSLRCSDGKVMASVFDVQCQEDGNWTEPTWPDPSGCADGAPCELSAPDAIADFPAYLALSSSAPPAPVSSGTSVSIVCSASGHSLDLDWDGFVRECYNGEYVDWWKKPGMPAEDNCIKIDSCASPHVYSLNVPDHMTTNKAESGSLDHLERVDFTCTGGKKLISPTADPDEDEKVGFHGKTPCNMCL
jgi:hypothetical protein